MVALLLVLIVVWLEALQEAMQIRRLKRTQKIFTEAFSGIKNEDSDVYIDQERGEIVMKAKGAFETGIWVFNPNEETRNRFISTRATLSRILEKIELKFKKTENISAIDHIEVLVVGHTDCVPFAKYPSKSTIKDNWDLSVLRATAIAKFFTEQCNDNSFYCCDDGSQNCSEDKKRNRIDPHWRILPAGRGPYEPTRKNDNIAIVNGECNIQSTSLEESEWLQEQRRVVVQIVPRLDKLMIQDELKK